jgi:D-xylose transport system substrate-binding protein
MSEPEQAPEVSGAPSTLPAVSAKKPRPKLAIWIAGAALLLVAGGAWAWLGMARPAPKAAAIPAVRIGLSLDSLETQRWGTEALIMKNKAAQMGAVLTTYNANRNDATQVSQIENLIAQKVDVIIIVAHDAQALAGATEDAKKAGIKVIAYDRLIEGNGTTEYISFSSFKVGEMWADTVVSALPASLKTVNIAFIEGPLTDNNVPQLSNGVMSVLTPLIKAGKVKLVFDQHIADWDPGAAYTAFKAYLATGKRADAVIGDNDDLGYGAIRALQEIGLAGKVPVTGQDAQLAAVQRLLSGTQLLTIYKPGSQLANRAIEDAIALTRGHAITTNATTSNKTVSVPTYLFDPVAVTKDTIKDTVIKGGAYTVEQVYGTSVTH